MEPQQVQLRAGWTIDIHLPTARVIANASAPSLLAIFVQNSDSG